MSYITGKTIKQLRERKDMTQKELARKKLLFYYFRDMLMVYWQKNL